MSVQIILKSWVKTRVELNTQSPTAVLRCPSLLTPHRPGIFTSLHLAHRSSCFNSQRRWSNRYTTQWRPTFTQHAPSWSLRHTHQPLKLANQSRKRSSYHAPKRSYTVYTRFFIKHERAQRQQSYHRAKFPLVFSPLHVFRLFSFTYTLWMWCTSLNSLNPHESLTCDNRVVFVSLRLLELDEARRLTADSITCITCDTVTAPRDPVETYSLVSQVRGCVIKLGRC